MSEKKIDPFAMDAAVPAMEGSIRPEAKLVARISRRVLFVVMGFIALVFILFMFALDGMEKKKVIEPSQQPADSAQRKKTEKEQQANTPTDMKSAAEDAVHGVKTPPNLVTAPPPLNDTNFFSGAPKAAASSPASTPASAVPVIADGKVPAIGGAGDVSRNGQGQANSVPPPLTPEQQLENQEKMNRLTRTAQARVAGLSAKSFDGEEKMAGAPAGPVTPAMADLLAAAQKAGASSAVGGQNGMAKSDGEQEQKLDFLKNAEKDDRGYHPHVSLSAMSRNEIKASSFIPMTLEQNINSDLPGMITARVTENVYDTITGCRLLIPSMSRVLGKYDSKVALGQGRMLVVWNSIIFPDGAELNLAGMQGYDTGGSAGLESDVDNHYWRLFGLTFGLSLISTGVQMSAPPVPTVVAGMATPTPTAAQVMASALAQQYGQLGAQILGKYMSVQPTLRNFAGERFTVMIPRTIVFQKVWRTRCAG